MPYKKHIIMITVIGLLHATLTDFKKHNGGYENVKVVEEHLSII